MSAPETVLQAAERVQAAASGLAFAVGQLRDALDVYRSPKAQAVPSPRRVAVEVAALLSWLGLRDVVGANPSLSDLNAAPAFVERWAERPAAALPLRHPGYSHD